MQILIKMRVHVTQVSMRSLLITAFAQWLFVLGANVDVSVQCIDKLSSASTSSALVSCGSLSWAQILMFLPASNENDYV